MPAPSLALVLAFCVCSSPSSCAEVAVDQGEKVQEAPKGDYNNHERSTEASYYFDDQYDVRKVSSEFADFFFEAKHADDMSQNDSYALCNETSDSKLSPIQGLIDTSAKLQDLLQKSHGKNTLCDLIDLYDKLAQLPSNSSHVSSLQLNASSRVLFDTGLLFDELASKMAEFDSDTECNTGAVTIVKVVQVKLAPYFLDLTVDDRGQLFDNDANSVGAVSYAKEKVRAAFVIYPENRSPLHPWPLAGLHRLQVYDVHLIAADNAPGRPAQRFYGMLVFNRVALSWTQNLQFGCAHWSPDLGDWTSEHCFLNVDLEYPDSATCYCETQHNGKSTQYILYEFAEDIHKFMRLEERSNKTINNSSNATEMRTYEDRSKDLTDVTDWKSFDVMITKVLASVMQFDSSVLERNSSSEFFERIGDVLQRVQPENGAGMIGRGSDIGRANAVGKSALHAFVVDLTKFVGDPPIAFAFYHYPEFWFECFRSRETIDLNRLFFRKHQFSLMFSSSVLRQNARYGFVVYPVGKFTKPASAVGDVVTKTSRVLDLVLLPRSDVEQNDTQLVHMLFSVDDDNAAFEVGCAFWSAALHNWTTSGCNANPDLYRGVCTCEITASWNTSQTRGQFVVFKFSRESELFERKPDSSFSTDFGQQALLALRAYKTFPEDKRLVPATVRCLNNIFDFLTAAHFRLAEDEKERAAQDARQVIMKNMCDVQPTFCHTSDACAVGYSAAKTNASDSVVAFSFDRRRHRQGPTSFTARGYKQPLVFNKNTSFAVHVSEAVTSRNSKVAFLIYPSGQYLRHLPSTDRLIISSRVVDIALVPARDGAAVDSEQLVEIYLDQSELNTTLRCALWSDDLKDWQHDACAVTEMASVKFCSCQVPPSGGTFLGYTCASVVFDEEVYKKVITNAIPLPGEAIIQASALAHNASLLTAVEFYEFRMMTSYLHILMLEGDVIAESQALIEDLLADIDRYFARYRVDPMHPVWFISSITGSFKTKSAELQSELFTNAVLTANLNTEITLLTLISIVGIGYYNPNSTTNSNTNGFLFSIGAKKQEQLRFLESHLNAAFYIPRRPVLICYVDNKALEYYRLIFAVYPMGMTPYSKSVSTSSVFNSRQVDIHLDADNAEARLEVMDSSSVVRHPIVDIFFQPTTNPKDYVTIGCASWDASSREWAQDAVCSMVRVLLGNNSFDRVCRCNVTGRDVTRVMMFEFTERQNFEFVDKLSAPQIVFLIGASLSFFGLTVIFLTAALFAKWREELGNKIMVHLAVSSFLYLTLTAYRETHEIFADTNHSDLGLIVFTVCVHYTRLTHYCWGLTMSVLQYRRFSGVVGATTISHLLLKVSVLAWGLPVVPLAVLLAWNRKRHFCGPDPLTHYVLYLVPGVIISLFNIGLMVAIIGVITSCCGCRNDKELQRHGVNETEVMLRKLKQTVLMFFLFGIPAVFEMFNDFGGHLAALEYINKILDPIQGFVLFLFFVVLDTKTSGYWRVKILGADAVPVKTAPKKVIARKVVKKKVPPVKLASEKIRSKKTAQPV